MVGRLSARVGLHPRKRPTHLDIHVRHVSGVDLHQTLQAVAKDVGQLGLRKDVPHAHARL